MFEAIAKTYAVIKSTLAKEYGEEFARLPEEAQAAAVMKVMSDLMKNEPKLAAFIGEKYLAEIA